MAPPRFKYKISRWTRRSTCTACRPATRRPPMRPRPRRYHPPAPNRKNAPRGAAGAGGSPSRGHSGGGPGQQADERRALKSSISAARLPHSGDLSPIHRPQRCRLPGRRRPQTPTRAGHQPHLLRRAGKAANSVWRHNPHRDAGTDKQAERKDGRADNHSGHRQFVVVGTGLSHGRQHITHRRMTAFEESSRDSGHVV
jgi:hypothetical protein